jgi:methylaspartate mutase sigma subunit
MSDLLKRGRRIVLSTVSSDAHTWNLVFLQLSLQEQGFEVVNLGPCVPDEVLIDAVRLHRPDAVVISSVNGHGHLDGARVIQRLRRDPEIGTVPVMIGGKLGIQGDGNAELALALVEAGFTAVFTDSSDPAELGRHLGELTDSAEPRASLEAAV